MQVVVDVPERYLVNTSEEELAMRLKLLSALLMYQAGELSAGAACELAGIDRYHITVDHRLEVSGKLPAAAAGQKN